EIDPIFYDKPYYIAPDKKGRHAYALLREALRATGKVGIAKVVLRTREYVASVKPSGAALVLELMHFADEIVSPSSLELPAKEKPAEGEMKAARMLIDAMAAKFDASRFHDTYKDEVRAMLEARAAGAPPPKAVKRAAPKANVVDLVSVLERSLAQHAAKGPRKASRAP